MFDLGSIVNIFWYTVVFIWKLKIYMYSCIFWSDISWMYQQLSESSKILSSWILLFSYLCTLKMQIIMSFWKRKCINFWKSKIIKFKFFEVKALLEDCKDLKQEKMLVVDRRTFLVRQLIEVVQEPYLADFDGAFRSGEYLVSFDRLHWCWCRASFSCAYCNLANS